MANRKFAALIAVAAVVMAACSSTATPAPSSGGAGASTAAAPCTVGVSWNNFQQPRWAAHDQPNIKSTVEAGGGTYIDADANLSNEQQLTDIDTLISKGANVLILLAQDNKAVLPGLQKAKDAGIPVIAYDRLIEDPSILYITFDNVLVGKAEADAVIKKVPTGNYVLIKGDPGDPNASTFLPSGLGRGRPEGQGRLRRHQDHRPGGRHIHRRLEDREGPVQHGSDHRPGQRVRQEDRCHPRGE